MKGVPLNTKNTHKNRETTKNLQEHKIGFLLSPQIYNYRFLEIQYAKPHGWFIYNIFQDRAMKCHPKLS